MSGSAVFPFIVGTAADELGLKVLPIMSSIIACVSRRRLHDSLLPDTPCTGLFSAVL